MAPAEMAALLDRTLHEAEGSGADAYLVKVDKRIREYEARYGTQTQRLHERLKDGSVEDTFETTDWLFLAEVRRRLLASRQRGRAGTSAKAEGR